MLVLTRRLNEVISIDGGIKIKVLEVRNGRVKIGFEAPPNIRIHRDEVANQSKGKKNHERNTGIDG